MKVLKVRAVAWKHSEGARIDVIVTYANKRDRRIEAGVFYTTDARSTIHQANVLRDNVITMLMDAGAEFEHGAIEQPTTFYGFDE